uniref:ATP synthase F0 subunit 8 n=1 Tax=Cyriopagopus schmidti TaxID=29017 RepID=Q6JT29_CYRSC|nr:ATP synthase F0 subunit 8 [Cyriopagopus schmidti]AAP51149.1 ATP synthase F0 subunit 8 [Cyriopagopus schmidti]
MPQMGPMMWLIFPLILMFMLTLSMGTLDSEMNVSLKKENGDAYLKKLMKW